MLKECVSGCAHFTEIQAAACTVLNVWSLSFYFHSLWMPAKHKDRPIRLSSDAFLLPRAISENVGGMKAKPWCFHPSRHSGFPPPRLLPRSSSSSSCSSAPWAPARLSPEALPQPPDLRRARSPSCSRRGLVASPGFPGGWALQETTAGFYSVSLQQEIWFCFPQISVSSFSSHKNTKEINCFLKRSHRLKQMCLLSRPFPLYLSFSFLHRA